MTCSNKRHKIYSSLLMTAFMTLSLLTLSSCSEKEKNQAAGDGNTASFLIDPKETVEYDFAVSGDPNAGSLYFQKLLTLKICLKDVAETKTIAKANFKVVAGDVSVVKSTDLYGCFLWQELIQFDPNNNEKTFYMSRKIEAMGKHVGAVNFEYSVNPSQDKGKVVIYPDKTGSEETGSSAPAYQASGIVKVEGKNRSYDVFVNIEGAARKITSGSGGDRQNKTVINTLELNYRGIEYRNIRVDQKLNLILPYSYSAEFSISFLKQKLTQLTEEKIRNGNFMFHLIFAKVSPAGTKPQAKDIYASAEFRGRPFGDQGIIRVPEVTLPFANLSALANRMSVYFTVTSLDRPALFPDQTYEGIVTGVLANQKLQIGLSATEVNAHEIYSDHLSFKSQKAMDDLNVLESLKSDGFWPVEKTRVSFQRSNKEQVTVDLAKLVADTKDESSLDEVSLEALCEAIFNGASDKAVNELYAKCRHNPKSVVVAEIREYVKSLKSIARDPYPGLIQDFTLNSNMKITQSKSSEVAAKGKMGVSVEPSEIDLKDYFADKGGISKIKYGFEAETYVAGNFITSKTNDTVLESEVKDTLTSQQINVELDVVMQKCLVLSVNKSSRETLKNHRFSAERVICVDGLRETRKEQYYFIQYTKKSQANGLVDVNAAETNPVRIMIFRGNKIYDSFMALVQSKSIIEWVRMDERKGQFTSFMTEEAPLLLSAGNKVIIPDPIHDKLDCGTRCWIFELKNFLHKKGL